MKIVPSMVLRKPVSFLYLYCMQTPSLPFIKTQLTYGRSEIALDNIAMAAYQSSCRMYFQSLYLFCLRSKSLHRVFFKFSSLIQTQTSRWCFRGVPFVVRKRIRARCDSGFTIHSIPQHQKLPSFQNSTEFKNSSFFLRFS